MLNVENRKIAGNMRQLRNKAVAKAHERLARDALKHRDDEQGRRMEALKAHDFEAYQEMLAEKQGADGGRYEAISKFLTETEEYLNRLAGKVAHVRAGQQAAEAQAKAIAEAIAQGLTDDEAQALGASAFQEAAQAGDADRAGDMPSDAQSRYYTLAHAVEEAITKPPSLLKGPKGAQLREYQMVGLQWMVSLYNNHLNGILADEMGLGKTVQVMALLAYLMEHKNNYGPHIIIVPNAVIVNWKSELNTWLPDSRCVYYVGNKEERHRKYVQEVAPLQFNVLVTTYEFVMRDRTKLSKLEWKYLIIDEAQRMKDRKSKLSTDLDKFTAARRLLLTGTPLQNELQELWSLLNLLLPEVFDDKGQFGEWFGETIGKEGPGGKDSWLETEKRVVVINRLHQILEPFMLRRQVQDVEGKLPPKVAYTVRIPMSAYQNVMYEWVQSTGTLRRDPDEHRVGKSTLPFVPLNNKAMELRKICNHPALSYQPSMFPNQHLLLRQCGKFCVLDRMLVKLHRMGHRVLLFCTMTRLLDQLEQYLRWRRLGPDAGDQMQYLRIDGSTSLEERERAIQKFNAEDSQVFIFLLSIRAAGRQTADTVIIYDPDANPKNEEQAIARAHRIGQNKEVRVFHLEMVRDAPRESRKRKAGSQPEQRMFKDSIESLLRNEIQQHKIDMANEIIDAGRFNMKTTNAERRDTLEEMLKVTKRSLRSGADVPSHAELNRMLARSPDELEVFDHLDATLDWPGQPLTLSETPGWLRWDADDLNLALTSSSKHTPLQIADLAAAANVPGLAVGTASRKVVEDIHQVGPRNMLESLHQPPCAGAAVQQTAGMH
eukprot:jgi/Astpho2/9938/e_gw1.00152.85.1_t